MHFEIITLFPEMFDNFMNTSIVGRAKKNGLLTENRINPRTYAVNDYGQVDDAPYGGEAGMVMRPEPAAAAIAAAKANCGERTAKVIFFTPQGKVLTQSMALEMAETLEAAVLFCGHYKGLDERVCERYIDEEISIGDYVVTGGELPAMVFMDAVIRLRENVLGNKASAEDDSFHTGFLEHPLYTRPEEFEGMKVPEVLRGGHHRQIQDWYRYQSLKRTFLRRPDLLRMDLLNEKDRKILEKIKGELQ
jgi:tRNA (guanine37-N1)-methyltransferase